MLYPYSRNFTLKFLVLVLMFLYSWQCFAEQKLLLDIDEVRIKNNLNQIIHPNSHRNYKNIAELNRVSAWIKQEVESFGLTCEYQNFEVESSIYRNVICRIPADTTQKIIVGAHYDVYGDFDGADDNASGVVGVIEVARLIQKNKQYLHKNVEFVFYSLEEPPFFRTENMGSSVHAQSILNDKNNISAVYILEMIGYFDDAKIQDYPMGLGMFYPSQGNFIAAIGNFKSRELTAKYCTSFKKLKSLNCERLIAPSFI